MARSKKKNWKKNKKPRASRSYEARKRYDVRKDTPDHHFTVRIPRIAIDPGRRWYVAKTLPRHEMPTAIGLAHVGVDPFVPCAIHTVRRRRGIQQVDRLLLPGYLFAGFPVATDALEALSAYNYAEHELMNQRPIVGVYGPVRSANIQAFADFLSADPEPCCSKSPFELGQAVIVHDGPLAWFHGIVEEMMVNGRVLAEVNIFGRLTPVEFDAGQLMAA